MFGGARQASSALAGFLARHQLDHCRPTRVAHEPQPEEGRGPAFQTPGEALASHVDSVKDWSGGGDDGHDGGHRGLFRNLLL
jgi:hypothetical protein